MWNMDYFCDDAKTLKVDWKKKLDFWILKILLEKYELTKLGFWIPLYNNSKYREFTKIGNSKILSYNKIHII